MRKILAKVMAAIIAVALIGSLAACGSDSETTTAATEGGDTTTQAAGDSDSVVVAGIDGNFISLKSIKEGKVYATAYDWSILQGYDAVYQAIDLIEGKSVPETTTSPDTIITEETRCKLS